MAEDTKQHEFEEFARVRPRLTILTDHPLVAKEAYQRDALNLRFAVGPAYDIIRHPETRMPMTIAIYGDWGAGKTSAMRWLHGLIEDWNEHGEGKDEVTVRPVWFYPWKYDNKEDVCRGLISEVIIASIDVKGATLQRVKNAAKQFGVFLGRSFLHVLAGVKLTAKAPGGVGEAELDLASIKEVLAEYEEAAHPEKAYLNEFENALENWVSSTLGPKERMVVFIDDLDRCLPDVALKVLEALKLYLNIDKLIFVIGVDRRVVEELVRQHYKELKLEEGKSINYLAKMFQVEVMLAPSERQIEALLEIELAKMTYWTENLSAEEQQIFHDLILKEAKKNPREIKRLINNAVLRGVGALMSKGESP